MNIIVATKQMQGKRKNDFSHATEGEVVYLPMECDRESVDGACGCRRSFSGVDSHKSTTTGIIANLAPEVVKAARDKYRQNLIDNWKMSATDADTVVVDFDALVQVAAAYPIGSVVEKRGNKIQMRIS